MVAIKVLSPFVLSWAQGTQTPGMDTAFSEKVEGDQTCPDRSGLQHKAPEVLFTCKHSNMKYVQGSRDDMSNVP